MRMSQELLLTAAAILTIMLASCVPPEPVPPPFFRPHPPYPPQPVDRNDPNTEPDTQPVDPNGQIVEPRAPEPTPEAPATPSTAVEYPTAQATTNANEVISPYEPHNIISVEGFHSGQLARDPSNKKIFRVP